MNARNVAPRGSSLTRFRARLASRRTPCLSLAAAASSVSLSVLGLALGGASAGCGSPPAPAPPPVPVTAAPPAAAPADVSAVPEPKNLLLFARLNKASEARRVLGEWTHLPMPESDTITETLTGEALGDLVDLDQPMDFAVEATPHGMSLKPLMAAAVAVRSLDQAKRALAKFKLTPGENGSLMVEGLGRAPGGDDDEGDPKSCELAAAYGAAPTRLVCGDSPAALTALAAYLTRTTPRASFPSDLHLELRLEPVRPVVEQSRRALPMLAGAFLGIRRNGTPGIDELFDAAFTDLADLTSDLDKVTFDAMLANAQGTVTVNASFRSAASFLARLATGHPERADVPPPAFWRLPESADFAHFHRGIDAKDFEHPRDHLVTAFGASLEKEGMAAADRSALTTAAQHALDLLAFPAVHAKGVDVAEAQKALAAVKSGKAGDEEVERVALEKVAGWWVIGIEQEPSKVVAALKEWPAALARPGVAKWIKAQAKDAPAPSLSAAALPAGLGLKDTKDAASFELTVYRPHHADGTGATGAGNAASKPAATRSGKPLKLRALVLPDGARTWIVFAADVALAVSKARVVLDAKADGQGTLATRGGLEAMRDARVNSAGFVTARGFMEGNPFAWVANQPYGVLHHDVFAGLATTPAQGGTPIPYTFTAQAGAGANPGGASAMVETMAIPRAAIEDIVRLAMSGMRR